MPCGPIHDYAEVFADPHTQARAMEVALEHPVEGTVRALGIPVKLVRHAGLGPAPGAAARRAHRGGAGRGGLLRRRDRGAGTGMSEVLLERRGPAAWVTFNRPQAHNAMTFAMYEALFARCEEVDADDDVRVARAARRRWQGVRGRDGHPPVRGLRRVGPRTALAYEATIDRIVGRLETVGKPTIALVDGFAMGSGLALSAACDLRVCTPAAKFGLPIARTVGNCLSMENYARLEALLGPARLKDIVFTARSIGAEEALAIGLATELVEPEHAEQRVTELCERLATHAPVTLRVTKEALRRLRAARVPAGEDLVREAYGSEGFRRHVAAFMAKRDPR